jgi:hypothetical protein
MRKHDEFSTPNTPDFKNVTQKKHIGVEIYVLLQSLANWALSFYTVKANDRVVEKIVGLEFFFTINKSTKPETLVVFEILINFIYWSD